ncbi:hypothetical protein BaRGS_00000404 [Batillaria attramentaria]|uniref:Uncharacterized protein n=1 Tax=Batillaria attramentaria TaxID=370345 RepID=A0ABD0M943_9CAEN
MARSAGQLSVALETDGDQGENGTRAIQSRHQTIRGEVDGVPARDVVTKRSAKRSNYKKKKHEQNELTEEEEQLQEEETGKDKKRKKQERGRGGDEKRVRTSHVDSCERNGTNKRYAYANEEREGGGGGYGDKLRECECGSRVGVRGVRVEGAALKTSDPASAEHGVERACTLECQCLCLAVVNTHRTPRSGWGAGVEGRNPGCTHAEKGVQENAGRLTA